MAPTQVANTIIQFKKGLKREALAFRSYTPSCLNLSIKIVDMKGMISMGLFSSAASQGF